MTTNEYFINAARAMRFDSIRDGVCMFRVGKDDVYMFPEINPSEMVCVTLGANPKVEFISVEIL